MTAATALPVAVALVVGLLAGFALARLRRTPRVVEARVSDLVDDETRPTLVPFRVAREGGRKAARTDPDERGTRARNQLEALLSDLDRPKDR